MKQLIDILLQSANKNIQESLLLKRAFKEIVNEKIASVTTDLIYKNNVLYVYVKDNVWATQLMQYKHTIFKRAKEIVGTIKDVKITVSYNPEVEEKIEIKKMKRKQKDITGLLSELEACDPKYRIQLKQIILGSVQEHAHVCVACGSPIIAKENNFCSLCLSQNKAIRSKDAQNILKETPWIKYEEIDPIQRKNLNYEGFMKEKKFKLNRICDIIENEYFDIKKNQKSKTELFKSKIEELVILKISIEPSELTDQIIENNIPKKWFKLYQS
jgi:hypothetical protein